MAAATERAGVPPLPHGNQRLPRRLFTASAPLALLVLSLRFELLNNNFP